MSTAVLPAARAGPFRNLRLTQMLVAVDSFARIENVAAQHQTAVVAAVLTEHARTARDLQKSRSMLR